MKMFEFLFVPTILFLTVVAPIWIVMHYANARKSSRSLGEDERHAVEELLADLDTMTERIEVLESILDHDSPHWREKGRARSRPSAASDKE